MGGKLDDIYKELVGQQQDLLLGSVRHMLSDEELGNLMGDFVAYRNMVLAQLQIKFGWAQRLP